MEIQSNRPRWSLRRLGGLWLPLLWLSPLLTGIARAEVADAGAFVLRVGYQPYFAPGWGGAIVRAAHLDAGNLPPGVKVDYMIGLQGAGVLVNALRRGAVDLAYLGITPAISVTQAAGGDAFRIIAVTSSSAQLCGMIVARGSGAAGLPPGAALPWLNGKKVGTVRGTCADLFLTDLIEANDLHPARIVGLTPDLLRTSMSDGGLDAVAVWEPFATAIAREAHGAALDLRAAPTQPSPAFIVARTALLLEHPDAVRGWLAAEHAAERILARRADRRQTLELLESQTRGLEPATLRTVLADSDAETTYPLVVTPAARAALQHAIERMARRGLLTSAVLRTETIDNRFARETLGTAVAQSGSAP
jgi:ABC-type nitrate/sulfonate/bicarbonate transport system substrate-binding protein